jgi:hypothetical protein
VLARNLARRKTSCFKPEDPTADSGSDDDCACIRDRAWADAAAASGRFSRDFLVIAPSRHPVPLLSFTPTNKNSRKLPTSTSRLAQRGEAMKRCAKPFIWNRFIPAHYVGKLVLSALLSRCSGPQASTMHRAS